MNELREFVVAILTKAEAMFLGPRFLWTVSSLAAFVIAVELATRRQWRRYLTRTFLTDLTYFLFFAGGLYYFFFSGPVERLAKDLMLNHASFLLINVYGFLPDAPKALVVIMTVDFIEYWMHRLGHKNSLYWKFHCIHHSPERLTPLSKFRIHWMDMLVFGTVKALPMLVLGVLNVNWMPYLPLMFLQVFSHFDIDFHYGPVVGRYLVSPRYHRVHHSADPAQQNTNFGIIFSCWDYLFGTAAPSLARPKAFGCPDMQVPESFLRQFFFPFLLVARRLEASAGGVTEPVRDAAR